MDVPRRNTRILVELKTLLKQPGKFALYTGMTYHWKKNQSEFTEFENGIRDQ